MLGTSAEMFIPHNVVTSIQQGLYELCRETIGRASSRIFCKGGQVLGSMKRGGAKLVVNLNIQSSLNSKGGGGCPPP